MTRAELQYAGVTPWAGLVPWRIHVEQLLDQKSIRQPAQGQSSRVHVAALAQRDQPFHKATKFLRSRFRGIDAFMKQHGRRQAAQQCDTAIGRHPESAT